MLYGENFEKYWQLLNRPDTLGIPTTWKMWPSLSLPGQGLVAMGKVTPYSPLRTGMAGMGILPYGAVSGEEAAQKNVPEYMLRMLGEGFAFLLFFAFSFFLLFSRFRANCGDVGYTIYCTGMV
jgi:hypothetical protein